MSKNLENRFTGEKVWIDNPSGFPVQEKDRTRAIHVKVCTLSKAKRKCMHSSDRKGSLKKTSPIYLDRGNFATKFASVSLQRFWVEGHQNLPIADTLHAGTLRVLAPF
jgi:hypothetical protein